MECCEHYKYKRTNELFNDMCPLTEKGKIALINFLNNDDCYNYRVSSFKFDFDIINADEYDNYIHEIYVKNDKYIQDLYEYFI